MKLNLKYFNLMGIAIALGVFIAGCYPNGPEYNSDYALVVTDYDSEFDFGSKKTYYMPDEIKFETNIDGLTDEKIREFEKLILDLIESNMSARGYTRIDTTAGTAPDLVMSVVAFSYRKFRCRMGT